MDCPECGAATVAFRVPPAWREFAPGGAAAVCPGCLALSPAEDADPDPDFGRIVGSFPDGEAGVAMALAAGLIADSVALHREAVASLFEAVADRGADPWLVLERLAASPAVAPDADLERARRQLEQLS